ncbi:MAG: type II secretion system protein [Planctomycetota bacterium]
MGFTLIELLIVISLIVMLMGILTVFGVQFQQKGYVARTEAMIDRLKLFCDHYKEKANRYPADGLDKPLETEAGTELRSGAALAYQLLRPIKVMVVDSLGQKQERGTTEQVGEFTDSEVHRLASDPAAVEITDAWGNPFYYDDLKGGASAYSPQESTDSHLEPSATTAFLQDPRENADLVHRIGPQNVPNYDLWSFGKGGNSADTDPAKYYANWSKKNSD